MRGSLCIAALTLLFAPVAVVSAQAPSTARVVAAADSLTQEFDVDGVRVVLRRVTANNVVAANVYLLGGVQQLTRETQGIELMLLETSEQGTARYPRERMRARMAQLGSSIGVNPGIDFSTVGLRSTVAAFDSSWAILADRIIAPTLDSASVELVRSQLITGIRQRTESPDALLSYLADSSTFVDHPYGLSTVGTVPSVESITRDMLRRYQSEQMVRSRIRVVIVGNVTRERVTQLVKGTLATLPAGSYAWAPPTAPAPRPSGATFVHRRLPTNYVQGYFVGPDASSPDYPALRLACAVLAGRLFAEIRERLNLTYAVDAPFRERAFAIGGLYVTTTQPELALGIMQREMRDMKEGTISEEGLERLVQQFIVTYFLDNETNADQADLLARAALYQGDYRRASQFVNDLRAVTPEGIRIAAERYFQNVRFAFIGDALKIDRRIFERF